MCDYLSILGLKLIHVSKGGAWSVFRSSGLQQVKHFTDNIRYFRIDLDPEKEVA